MEYTQSNPINCCIFSGILVEFTCNKVGEGQYMLGKGVLSLPDLEFQSAGQQIKIMCWEDVALRLKEVPINTWVKVLSCYSPSEFRGKLQDQFTVTSFQVISHA
jgi:hypothetical protein